MYNKKALKVESNKYSKQNPYKKDIIVDAEGQWNHPGKVTRIPSNNITMQGVDYPVWAQPNVGPGMMMQPGQDYDFPGADYVDEFPQMQKGGFVEKDLDDFEIEKLRAQGYIIEELPKAQEGKETKVQGLDDEYFLRQQFKESSFNTKAKSPAGAVGLAQIMPNVKADAVKAGIIKADADLYDPKVSMAVQKWYMNNLYNASFINKPNQAEDIRVAKTLAAYNWGRGNLIKHLNAQKKAGVDIYKSKDWIDSLPEETADYINKILYKGNPKFEKEYTEAIKTYQYKQDGGNVQSWEDKLDDFEIEQLKAQGYEVEELDEFQDGGVSSLEGDLISKVIMERNRDKAFVKRAFNPEDYPNYIQYNNDGTTSTHRMAWGEDDNGQAYMYPEIFNEANEAIRVPNQYADYISSQGYKNATGMNKKQKR